MVQQTRSASAQKSLKNFTLSASGIFESKTAKKERKKTSTSSILDPAPFTPFTVPLGFVKEGTKLDFAPSRDQFLPDIWEVQSHPRISEELVPELGRILIIPWPKNDPAYNKAFFCYAKENIPIPGGKNSTVLSLGWGHLNAGDIVFIRDIGDTANGENDSFECYVGGIDEETELGKHLTELRDETLGSRENREANNCTDFERCKKRAKPVGGQGRCYSCGLSHQKPRNVVTPSIGGKVRGKTDEEEDAHLKMRKDLVTTTVQAALQMFKWLLPEEYKTLEGICDVNNVPRLGTEDNVCWTGAQLNLSQPVPENNTIIDCIEALAFFGGKHSNRHDSVGGWTTVLSYPDIPKDEGWEGGRFHLVEFGLFVELEDLKSITFSGLRLHGGTPPLAPIGVAIPSWAYRWVVVLYPQGAVLDGNASLNIGANPDGSPVQLTSEMRWNSMDKPVVNGNEDNSIVEEINVLDEVSASTKELNFFDDGLSIMTPQAHIDFLARAFYQFLTYHQSRLPGGTIMKFEDYRETWSLEYDGITYHPGPWHFAPSLSQNKECESALTRWTDHCIRRAQVIPSESRSYKPLVKIIPPPRLIHHQTSKAVQATHVARMKTRTARIKRNKLKGKGNTTVDAVKALMQAPTINFKEDVLSQNLAKRKRNSADTGKMARAKRLHLHKDNRASAREKDSDEEESEDSEDESSKDETSDCYHILRFLDHRKCTAKCCSYEYLVEWDNDPMGTKDWIHEGQINPGTMFSNYKKAAFAQILDVIYPEPEDTIGNGESDEITLNSPTPNDIPSFQSLTPGFQMPFLNNITNDSILSIITLLEEGALDLKSTEDLNVPDTLHRVNQINHWLENSPLDSKTMQAAVCVWPLIMKLHSSSKAMEATNLLLHHTIMFTHYHLYFWVEKCIEWALDSPSASNWWYRLIQSVTEAITDGRSSNVFHFDSAQYLPMIQPSRVYEWSFQKMGYSGRVPKELLSSQIVFHWLGLPIDSNAKHAAQSLFLKHLIGSTGNANVLLIDGVWKAYSSPGSQLGTPFSRHSFPSKVRMNMFGSEVTTHPILGCEPSTEVQTLFSKLQEAHLHFLGLPSSSEGIAFPQNFGISSPQNPSTSAPINSVNQSPSMIAKTFSASTGIAAISQVQFFRDWLLEISEAVLESPSPLTREQARVLRDTDYYSPFRELAASRSQVQRDNGLFNQGNTRATIFSALIFRGILFNTGALHDSGHTGFFESLEAWMQFVAKYQHKGEAYICNSCAYGVTRGRSSSNAHQFWDSSLHLMNKLQEPDLTFTHLWQYIVTAKDANRHKLFPTFGNLSAYLLTVDFAYANFIRSPSLDELAKAVTKLDKGAWKGLEKMKVIRANASDDEVESGFQLLFHFLDGDEQFARIKAQVCFDYFMLEHSLCKISRGLVYENIYPLMKNIYETNSI